MKMIFKRLLNVKPKTLSRSFWIFVLITILLGTFLQVRAINENPALDSSVLPQTPADQTIGNFQTAEEINLSLTSDAPCRGEWNSRLGGIAGSIVDLGATMFVGDSSNGVCGTIAFNNGDPRLLASILNNGSNSGSLVESVFALNAQVLDQRPASGTEYFENRIYALFNSGTVSAQDDIRVYYRGTGFELLRPVQAFWGWSVNIVYALLIFIIIIVAFGIMFRSSLNGGVAVTLQQAIPNIALAMILVPLSYAITGLFIDGITVSVNVVHQFLLGPGAPGRGAYETRNVDFPTTGEFGGVVPYDFPDRGLHADDMRVSWLYSGQVLVTGNDSLGSGVSNLAEGLGLIFGISTFIESLGIGHWFIPIVNFILGIILLFTGLRIFAKLIVKYIVMILTPLVAPFVFASIALPGSGTKIITWYAKVMGSCTLAYVITYLMTILTIVFSSAYFLDQLPDAGVATFVPPLTAMESVLYDLAQSGNDGAVSDLLSFTFMVVAFGIYMLIPKTLHDIDVAFKIDKLPPFFGDILQSTKDSISLARATAQAPGRAAGLAGQGIGLAGKSVAGAAGTVTNARRWNQRIGQNIRNVGDIFRGRKPGEQNTDLYRRAASLRDELDSLERRRQNAIQRGGVVGNANAARLAAIISDKQGQLANLGQSVGGSEDAVKQGGKMSVEISWNRAPAPINFTEGFLESLKEIANLAPAVYKKKYEYDGKNYAIGKGKLKVKTENYRLTPDIVNRFAIFEVTNPARSDLSSDPKTGKLLAGPRGTGALKTLASGGTILASGLTDITFGKPYMSLRFDTAGASPHPDGSGSSWEMGFFIDFPSQQGVKDFLNDISPASPVKTSTVFFAIFDTQLNKNSAGNIVSNPFDIMILAEKLVRP